MSGRSHSIENGGADDSAINTDKEDQALLPGREEVGEVMKEESEKGSKPSAYLDLFIWVLFFFQGIGCMTAFNTYVNCPDYFIPMYGEEIMTIISFAFLGPNCLASFIMTFFSNVLNIAGFTGLFVVPYTVFIIQLIVFPFFAWIENEKFRLALTILSAMLSGVNTGLLEAGSFAWAFQIKPIHAQAISVGFGISGILTALFRLISELIHDPRDSAVFFFLTSSATQVVCLIDFVILLIVWRIKIYGQNKPKKVKKESSDDDHEDHQGEEPEEEKEDKPGFLANMGQSLKIYYDTVGMCWYNGLSIFLTFIVTLSLFPGITAVIPATSPNSEWGTRWEGAIMTTFFMIGDCIGRVSPIVVDDMCCCIPGGVRKKVYLVKEENGGLCWNITKIICLVCRFIFWIIFPFCYIMGSHYEGFDFVGLCFMLPFAISNGFLTTTVLGDGSYSVFSKAMAKVERESEGKNLTEEEKMGKVMEYCSKGGSLMTFCMLGGIMGGSLLGIGIFYLVRALKDLTF